MSDEPLIVVSVWAAVSLHVFVLHALLLLCAHTASP